MPNPWARPISRHATVIRDNEGDVMNMGTDGGTPAKDLSINFVPVAFPQYTPPLIPIKPLERQLWRVLNASAITYLDLKVLLKDHTAASRGGIAGRRSNQRTRHGGQSHHLGEPHPAASRRPR